MRISCLTASLGNIVSDIVTLAPYFLLQFFCLLGFLLTAPPSVSMAFDPAVADGQPEPVASPASSIEKLTPSNDLLKLPVDKTAVYEEMTLKEVILAALKQNHDIAIEKINTLISETEIGQAQSTFDPVIKSEIAEAGTNTQDAMDSTDRSESLTGSVAVSRKFISGTDIALTYNTADHMEDSSSGRYRSGVKISIVQDLLKDFGTDINTAKIKIAQKNHEKAYADYHQKMVDTIAEIQTAYWSLYKSSQTLMIREKAFELSSRLLNKKKAEAGLGTIATVDVVEVESEVASKITEYAEALKQVREDDITLRNLMAMPVKLNPGDGRLRPTTRPVFIERPFHLEKSLEDALSAHQEYQSILLEREAKAIEVSYYQNQLLPDLQVQASYGLARNDNHHWGSSAKTYGAGDEYEVGMVLSMPIGNRAAKSSFHKNQLELKKIDYRLRQKEAEIAKKIHIALNKVQQGIILLSAARTNVAIKEKNLTASERKTNLGSGTLRGLLDRQTDLIDARLTQLEAETEYQKAVVELYKARGTVDPGLQITFAKFSE